MKKSFSERLKNILNDRFVVFTICVILCFSILVERLFSLQILNGEYYANTTSDSVLKTVAVPAPRGNIYDKYGRPIATNESAFNVMINPSVQGDDLTNSLVNLVELFEKDGDKYVDDLPFTETEPYEFTFGGNETKERRWKEDMSIPEDVSKNINGEDYYNDPNYYDATETFNELKDFFDIPTTLSDDETRKVLNLECMVYMQRYRLYEPVTAAYDVSDETVTEIEEDSQKYKGIYIQVSPMRIYPTGKYTAHLVGYTGNISEDEYDKLSDKGYTQNDVIGKTGIEQAFEEQLRGQDGNMTIETNSVGRPEKIVDSTQPVPGDNVYLTIDSQFQEDVYNILHDELVKVIENKMRGLSSTEKPITQAQFVTGLVETNTISLDDIMNSQSGDYSYQVKEYIDGVLPDNDITTDDGRKEIKSALEDGITSGDIKIRTMEEVMFEQGVCTCDDSYFNDIVNGNISTLQVLFDQLDNGQIEPSETNLDPCTGSVVVEDVNTGDIISAVSYPSYDNNQFVNNVNNEYINKLNNDPTTPLIYRAFNEKRAPGSTFKMITAITGLENGVITPYETIYDEHTFKKAGTPYPSCWSSYSHGSINVMEALAVSCNYFFCEVGYRLGNADEGTTLDAISKMDKYMEEFGLNGPTGVEIGESVAEMASPDYKKKVREQQIENPTESDLAWNDGDTVRTAFGQGYNNYTAASMCKYIATLATNGTRYSMHFLDSVKTQDGESVDEYTPNIEGTVDASQDTFDVIDQGMLMVTQDPRGTASTVFKGFPMKIASKTGTAQEDPSRANHSSFAAFAPYDDPQIAVYVVIPYGDTLTTHACSSEIGRDVIADYFGFDAVPETEVTDGSLIY